MEVRDPVYGRVHYDEAEQHVIDHAWVQRLRDIRQIGFSFLPFPGATHSRFAHSLGVMHLAGRAFDQAYKKWQFEDPSRRSQLRSLVRLAALCHDIGHAPFSHCTEFSMPPLKDLQIPWYKHDVASRRASHEDYSIAILANTSLAEVVGRHFPFTARHIAALVSKEVTVEDDLFLDGRFNHRALLSQIVSSELDVDRLDYLVRDALHTGTAYGHVDVDWLIGNLSTHVVDDRVCLALEGRAVYAFDHFLLARHHMFLQVYFHHKSVAYEEHLRRYAMDPHSGWSLSADLEVYFKTDDAALLQHLKEVPHPMAERVASRRPYVRVLERHGSEQESDVSVEAAHLADQGVDVLQATSTGRLSRYQGAHSSDEGDAHIYVLEGLDGHPVESVRTLNEASQVFARYADARCIGRVYVDREDVARCRRMLGLPCAD